MRPMIFATLAACAPAESTCPLPTTLDAVASVEAEVRYSMAEDRSADRFLIFAKLDETDAPTMLVVQLRGEFGDGTVVELNNDVDYDTCRVCVLVYAEFDEALGSKDAFVVTRGTLALSTVAWDLVAGTVTDLELAHARLDSARATLDSDGCTSSIPRVTFAGVPKIVVD